MVLIFPCVTPIVSHQLTRPDDLGVTHWVKQPHRRGKTAPSPWISRMKPPTFACWITARRLSSSSLPFSCPLAFSSHVGSWGSAPASQAGHDRHDQRLCGLLSSVRQTDARTVTTPPPTSKAVRTPPRSQRFPPWVCWWCFFMKSDARGGTRITRFSSRLRRGDCGPTIDPHTPAGHHQQGQGPAARVLTGCHRHWVCTCARWSRTASRTRGAAHPSAAAASWARYARPVSMTSNGPNAHI